MPAPVPVLGYRSKSEAASALRAAGRSYDEIAAAIGCSADQARRLVRYGAPALQQVVRPEPRGPFTYAKPRPSSLVDEIRIVAARAQARREQGIGDLS